jgi:hypothetical protein
MAQDPRGNVFSAGHMQCESRILLQHPWETMFWGYRQDDLGIRLFSLVKLFKQKSDTFCHPRIVRREKDIMVRFTHPTLSSPSPSGVQTPAAFP